MKSKDIKIGRMYGHKEYPGSVWIGSGKRVMWEGSQMNSLSNFINKCLVLIIDGDGHSKEYIGQQVQSPEDCWDGYWDNFYLID